MTVAAIYDIHGNLPALLAVLQDIKHANADRIVAGGDVILGPMSREVLECLLNFDIPVQFIRGNCEVAVLAELAGRKPEVPDQVLETVRWTARQLRSEHEQVLARWPKTLRLEIAGLGEVLFCHATPRSENDIVTRLTAEHVLLHVLKGLDAVIVVCGHTHMQFDRMIGTTRVVNAGSVGMPFGRTGADWLLLGPRVELKHTPYDLEKAAELIRATTYPGAPQFAEQYVLNSPSEEKTLQSYARNEVGASTPESGST